MPEVNESELLREALKNLGLEVPGKEEKKEKKEKEVEQLVVLETRTIRGVVTCALCKTVTIQYIRFEKWSDFVWRMGKDYTDEECKCFEMEQKIQLQKATVKSCWACEGVLLSKDKNELVAMIISLYAPIPSKKEIWKYINELRMAAVKEHSNTKKKRKMAAVSEAEEEEL